MECFLLNWLIATPSITSKILKYYVYSNIKEKYEWIEIFKFFLFLEKFCIRYNKRAKILNNGKSFLIS